MNESAADFPPPSAGSVEAAFALLVRVPTTWAAVPDLSHLDGLGLGLLVAAGLVERRHSIRLRMAGEQKAVAIRFRFMGQGGLVEALEPALAEAWALWQAALRAGRKTYVEHAEGEGEWRLTDQGEQAAKEMAGGDVGCLRDFLRTPGVPGVEALPQGSPYRFVPGVWRPVVGGKGITERVAVVNAGDEPLSVRVENLSEVAGPLGDIQRAIEAGYERLGAGANVLRDAETDTGPGERLPLREICKRLRIPDERRASAVKKLARARAKLDSVTKLKVAYQRKATGGRPGEWLYRLGWARKILNG